MRGARAADIAATMTRKRESKGLESLAREGMTEQVPPPELRIMETEMEKLCVGAEWQGRRIILTRHQVVLARSGSDAIIDVVPLEEITKIAKTEEKSLGHDALNKLDNIQAKPKGNIARLPSQSSHGEEGLTEDEGKEYFALQIETAKEGYNSGRTYFFRTENEDERDNWIAVLNRHVKIAVRRFESLSSMKRAQARVRNFYDCMPTRLFITFIIVLNFVSSAIESQLRPEKNSDPDIVFYRLDIFFTIMFAVELCVNLFGHWWWPFWTNGWNWFDTIIVLLSIASFFLIDAPIIKSLRLIRALRVVRLIRQLKSLRSLVNSLLASMMPVLNAFVIVILVMSIYGVIGVNFFGDDNPQYFGTFDKAMFTMVQISTFDGWSVIARSMFQEDFTLHPGVVVYFCTYIMIVGYTLLSVVVAVLIDKFSAATHAEEQAENEAFITSRSPSHALDPLLAELIHFENDQDLTKRIKLLYETLDVDDSGDLTFDELVEGLRKLHLTPRIHLSQEDFDTITQHRTLCSSQATMTLAMFETVLKAQLKLYTYRQMGREIQLEGSSRGFGLMCCSIKQVLLDIHAQATDNREEVDERIDQLSQTIYDLAAQVQTITASTEDLIAESKRLATHMFGSPLQSPSNRALDKKRRMQSPPNAFESGLASVNANASRVWGEDE